MLIFILLQDQAIPKINELIGPLLSACAFILSSGAFIFTVIIQLKERKRNIRQTLSAALSDVARINVEVSNLTKNGKEETPETVAVLKNYNSQRGALVSNARFLISQNEKLITDADYELVAFTYYYLGDVETADEYFLKAIRHAPMPAQLHIHKRDYAVFLFNTNQLEKGRKLFNEALCVDMPSQDLSYEFCSTSYLEWAKLERDFHNGDEFDRLVGEAYTQCEKITNKVKNRRMKLRIDTECGGR